MLVDFDAALKMLPLQQLANVGQLKFINYGVVDSFGRCNLSSRDEAVIFTVEKLCSFQFNTGGK